MNRGIYTAAMGMAAAERWMEVTTNNLANMSTDGFKSDALAFGDALTREMKADGGRGRALRSIGSGPTELAEFTDRKVGMLRTTNNPLDVALTDPRAMFAVQDGGATRFTRNGAFTLNPDGEITTAMGARVLGEDGRPIRLESQLRPEIDAEGIVRQDGKRVGKIATYEGDFKKDGDGLWTGTGVRTLRAEVKQGALEGSNVDPLAQMVDLIKINRHLEMSQKAITTHDESSGKLLSLLGR